MKQKLKYAHSTKKIDYNYCINKREKKGQNITIIQLKTTNCKLSEKKKATATEREIKFLAPWRIWDIVKVHQNYQNIVECLGRQV